MRYVPSSTGITGLAVAQAARSAAKARDAVADFVAVGFVAMGKLLLLLFAVCLG
jgi:hypothetical protein